MGKNIIGRKLRIYRAMQNPPMQQLEMLAKFQLQKLDYFTQGTISRIENGDRAVLDYELLAISKALKVDILWLLGEKETPV